MLLALVRILHYSDVVEAARSVNAHNITLILTIHRLILAALCGLAALVVPSPAQADSLRADLVGPGVLQYAGIRGIWGALVPAVLLIAFGWWMSRELPAAGIGREPAASSHPPAAKIRSS